ncbi:hypothetical protein HPG69_000002, partial [Diceros bicornis minor]
FPSNCVVGASLEEITEEEEEDESKSAMQEASSAKLTEATFQITGMLSKPENLRPSFAVDTYCLATNGCQFSFSGHLSRSPSGALLECDAIICNITESLQQGEAFIWAVSGQ